MKKTVLVLFLALISGWVSAQQRRTYVSEGFQGGPNYIHDELWDLSSSSASLDVLYYSNTQEAGGEEPWEGLLAYWPEAGLSNQLDGTYRYVLVKKNMLSVTTNYVSVKYNYTASDNSVEGSRILGLAARQSGGEWQVLQQISKMPKNLGRGLLVGVLPETMRGAEDVQVCLFYTTPKDNIKYYLYIDDIEWFGYMDNAYGADFAWQGLPYTTDGKLAVDLLMKNTGNKMESCEISYTLDGGAVQTIPLTFANGWYPGQTHTQGDFVPQGWDAAAYGKHTLEFWISKVNGADVNTAHQVKYLTNIDPASPAYQYRPLVEHFSSSTCGPCANLNKLMNPIYEELGDTITMIKYQVDFPYDGDPYATDESIARRFYYQIGGVPTVILDGTVLAMSGQYPEIAAALKAAMLAATDKKVYFDMQLDTVAVDAAQNIHISLKVKAVGGAENVILHTVVEESVTHGNATTNGETEFHNVMMKMLPDNYGRVVTLLPDSVYTFNYVYDMTQTNMEEFTDLQVACFLQTQTGEVLQSVKGKARAYNAAADVALQVDYVPTYICAEEVPAGLRLVCAGGTDLTSVEIEAKVGATGTPVVKTYPVSVSWGESAYMVVDGLKATEADADAVYFTVTKLNGEAVNRPAVRRSIQVRPTQYEFLPLLENFTCGDAGSAVLNAYADAFDDEVCQVKIPMKGDRYTRSEYTDYAVQMGVHSTPALALNGCVLSVAADGKLADEDYFEALLAQTRRNPGIMKITAAGDVKVSGSKYNPQVTASLSFESAVELSCRLYAFMVETTTTGNAGNGETQIKRVVQSLYPGENGISMTVSNGIRYLFKQSSLNPQVEDYNNLTLVILIKNEEGTEVLQTAEFPLKNDNVANESLAAYQTLSVYPNPASEYIYLKALENATVDVFDLTGVKVFGLSGVNGDYTLDVRGYVPGAYIIKVSEGAKVSTARISVVR